MIGEAKMSVDVSKPKQAMKKPIRLVISNGEYHVTRRATLERRDDVQNACINNVVETNNTIALSNNATSNQSNSSHTPTSTTTATTSSATSHISNNDKAYFGSPLPMYGGRFLGSPMYTTPLTPPLDESLSEEVMQVDDYCDEGLYSRESIKSPLAKYNPDVFNGGFQYGKVASLESKQMKVDDYLSASSSDDGDDEEVCQLMFRNNDANSNEADYLKNVGNNSNIVSNNTFNSTQNNGRHGPDTRSKTNSLRSTVQSRTERFPTFSPMRLLVTSCRSDACLSTRVLRRFRSIDVISNRPSLNFRKMRKSSFYRKHPRHSPFI